MDYSQLDLQMEASFGKHAAQDPPVVPPVSQDIPPATDTTQTPVIPPMVAAPEATPPVIAEPTFLDNVPDILKDTATPPSVTPPAPPVEIPQEIKLKMQEYEKTINELKSQQESDPFLKTYNELKNKEGFDYKKLAAELNPKDYSKVPLKDLVREDIKGELGLEGDELEFEVDQFFADNDLEAEEGKIVSKYKIANLEDQFRQKLAGKQKKSEWLTQLEAAANKNVPVDTSAQDAQFIALFQKDKSEIKGFADQLVGQEVYGVVTTAEEMNEIVNSYDDFIKNPYIKADGSIDQRKYTTEQLIIKKFPKFIAAAIEHGKKETLRGKTNIDANGGSSTSAAPSTDTRSNLEILKEQLQQSNQ